MDSTAFSRRLFRKSLVIPAEHGAWSWLLTPFAAGAVVASAAGQANAAGQPLLALILTLVGGLSAYTIRQPATVWLRIRRRRAKRADEPLAMGWVLFLAAVAALCLIGLLALGRVDLRWLLPPFVVVLALYLAATRSGRAAMRALWMELAGAVGLALMAPAAVIAVTGSSSRLAWGLWALFGLQNALGVLYVRLRLADTHQRPMNRLLVLWGHALGLAVVALAGLAGWLPLLAALPFAGFLLRAAWAVRRLRPVADVRRFGFIEVAAEVLSGTLIAIGYIG